MSHAVTNWVFKYSESTLASRLVLLALADYAHDDGAMAFPSIETIAHKARVSPRTARYSLRRLEETGAIERMGKTKYGTTIYRVLMQTGEANIAAPREANIAGQGRQDLPPEGARSAADPVVNPSPEPSDISSTAVVEVFEYWRQAFSLNGQTKLTPGRRQKIAARLKTYPVERLKRAIDGCAGSQWHRANGHIGLEKILSSDEKLEEFERRPVAASTATHSAYDRPAN